MGHYGLPAAMQGTSAFDALLLSCRDFASGRFAEAVAAMLAKADEALAEQVTKTQDRDQQKRLQEAREVARAKGAELEKQFHQRFLAEFQQRSNKARQIGGGFADADLSSMELSLVADEALEETLKFNELAARLRRLCEDEVNALDQRVGVLLGDADLDPESNPLGPNAVCDAYKHACQGVIEAPEMRAVFLQLFDALVLEALNPVYAGLNDLLVQNSILPKIRYGAPKKEQKKKKKSKDGDADEEPDAQDLFAMLQKLASSQGGGPGGAGSGSGVGGAPLIQGTELLNSLTQLQLDGLAALGAGATLPTGPVTGTTNVLHELKSSQVGAAMGQVDAMTLDVVAMLFDQLFDDPKIPLGAKGLIGRMQIPVLKVAIADKTFFQKKDHPVRQLLDTLGEIAIRLPADFNTGSALFGHLETIIQGLITDYKDDIEIFNVVREQLVALMAREDKRIEDEARAASQRILQEEALAVAKDAAQAELATRVQAASLPGAVIEFLIEHWQRLMMLIHVRRGPESEPWKRSLEVMDQLVWSVQPKEGGEERRKLMIAIPPLLKGLGAGLAAAGIADEVRETFFADLMRFHTAILSAPPKSGAAPPPELNLTPGKALDFTAPVTMRNPFGEGEVKVTGAAAELADDAASRRRWDPTNPDNLKVGDWLEFKEPAAEGAEARPARPARLIFITPKKTRYVFCDRGEKDYIECTRAEIARRLRGGEAVVMEEEPEVPFFERIMGGVMRKMKGKAA